MPNVDSETERRLAEALPDHPFTFGARCLLLRGLAKAWVRGVPERFEAVVVQSPCLPKEPMAFGSDPEAIWSLLQEVPGWECVELSVETAPALKAVLERELGLAARLYDDVFYVLEQAAIRHEHPSVRRLNEDDADLVDRAPSVLHPAGFSSTVAALTGGVAAGGIVDGNLVSIISMTVSSEEFADIGGHTLERWRNRGLASAAAYIVARELQTRGFRPVWSTGEDNVRSQRVAEKLGFREFGRTAYVIVSALQGSGGFRPSVPKPA
jgi:GNAT acetyltransferase